MKIAIVANGEAAPTSFLSKRLRQFDLIIAVDGGLRPLIQTNLTPFALVGDFDSITPEEIAHYPDMHQEKFPRDKDKSDTELAVEYAFSLGATEIVLFSALGKRVDHALANLFLLSRYAGKLSIETESETVYAIHGFHKQFSRAGQTFSLMSLDKAEGVTTHGMKWNIQDKDIDSHFFSLSNEAFGNSVEISVRSGTLICVVQNV